MGNGVCCVKKIGLKKRVPNFEHGDSERIGNWAFQWYIMVLFHRFVLLRFSCRIPADQGNLQQGKSQTGILEEVLGEATWERLYPHGLRGWVVDKSWERLSELVRLTWCSPITSSSSHPHRAYLGTGDGQRISSLPTINFGTLKQGAMYWTHSWLGGRMMGGCLIRLGTRYKQLTPEKLQIVATDHLKKAPEKGFVANPDWCLDFGPYFMD